MLAEHRRSDHPDPSGNGGDGLHQRFYLLKEDVTADAALRGGVDADIDHNLIGIDKAGIDQPSSPDGDNQDVCLPADALRACSIIETGSPTTRLRPMTAMRFPAGSIP